MGQGEVQRERLRHRRATTTPAPASPTATRGRTSSAARCRCCRSRSTRSTATSSCRRARRGRCSRRRAGSASSRSRRATPLHRAHEYALVVGLERLTREGHFAGAVLNPLVGETKGDDVDAVTRMKTYRALIDNKALGQGDTTRSCGRRSAGRSATTCMLLGLDIKMFYAGPKEAMMHAIYRQNFGFTDIIIGRKHADAPYDDGKRHLGRPGRPAEVRRAEGRAADQAGEGRLRGVLRGAGPRRPGGGVRARRAASRCRSAAASCARSCKQGRAARPRHHAAGNGPRAGGEVQGDGVRNRRSGDGETGVKCILVESALTGRIHDDRRKNQVEAVARPSPARAEDVPQGVRVRRGRGGLPIRTGTGVRRRVGSAQLSPRGDGMPDSRLPGPLSTRRIPVSFT